MRKVALWVKRLVQGELFFVSFSAFFFLNLAINMLKKAQQFGFQLVISLKHFQLGVGSFGLDGCLPRDLTAPHHHFSSGSWEKPAVNSFQGKWPVFFQLRKNSGKIRRTTQCDLDPKLKSDLFVPLEVTNSFRVQVTCFYHPKKGHQELGAR